MRYNKNKSIKKEIINERKNKNLNKDVNRKWK